MKLRRKAREMAVRVLYRLDMLGAGKVEGLVMEEELTPGAGKEADSSKKNARTPAVGKGMAYGETLVRGVLEKRDEIDALIERSSDNWKIDRMPVVDRNILRVAVYELMYNREVPYKAVIDEAVEIAKLYGAEDSGAFVNAVLDRARKEAPSKKLVANLDE